MSPCVLWSLLLLSNTSPHSITRSTATVCAMDLGGKFGLNSLRRLKSLCKMLRDDGEDISLCFSSNVLTLCLSLLLWFYLLFDNVGAFMSCVSLAFCFKLQNGQGAFNFYCYWIVDLDFEVQTLECSEYPSFAITITSTKTSGQHSFSCHVPKTRNQLPVSVCHASSLGSLRSFSKPLSFHKSFI